MKVVVFGANGRTGKELVKRLVEKGHEVVAVARNIDKLDFGQLQVEKVQAEVTKLDEVEKVFKKRGIEVVYNALGPKSLFDKGTEVVNAIENIIQISEKYKVKRFIHISFAAVREDRKNISLLYKYIIPNVMSTLVNGHKNRENLVKKSRLSWIIVQPPVLTDKGFTGKYKVERRIESGKGLKKKLSRGNLAHYMVELLEQPKLKNKEIFISE